MKFSSKKIYLCFLVNIFILCICLSAETIDVKNIGKQIPGKMGITVCVDFPSSDFLISLQKEFGGIIHGLRSGGIEKIKEDLFIKGMYGTISVLEHNSSELPYIDNMVNRIIVFSEDKINKEEILRVLRPGGMAVIYKEGNSINVIKPVPEGYDEWTHYLHDPSNNAVSKDKDIGAIKHLQWTALPRWTRHHDKVSSVNAVVSAKGRIFYVIDEGPAVSVLLPARWTLIARDAYNGLVLWKKPLISWQFHLYPLKQGPSHLPRRLVSVDDNVYVPLGDHEYVSKLDAGTGRVIQGYVKTKGTEEILLHNGRLFLVIDKNLDLQKDKRRIFWEKSIKTLMVLDEKTGKQLWQYEKSWIAPLTLTVDDTQVYIFNGESVIAFEQQSGKEKWVSASLPFNPKDNKFYAPRLVVKNGIALFVGGEAYVNHQGSKGKMTAIDTINGEMLWEAEHPPSGYQSPEDIFVINGLVWTGDIQYHGANGLGGKKHRPSSGVFTGRDIKTGEVIQTINPPEGDIMWFHHRCHPARATENYLLTSRSGIEVIDIKTGNWELHHWARGTCLYGILPANGMIYTPPHPCVCYQASVLNGFSALYTGKTVAKKIDESQRLFRNTSISLKKAPEIRIEEWPTYRYDNERSGFTPHNVPVNLKMKWSFRLPKKGTPLVIADNKVVVSSPDVHTIYVLNAETGQEVWHFIAGAPVNSPPTYHQGKFIFGCTDGYIYCLSALDGTLLWKYLAAPTGQHLISEGNIESVHPVNGSILVLNNKVYSIAGRSMFLDGGLRFVILNADTGEKIGENIMNHINPETGKSLVLTHKLLNMPTTLPDILASDGENIFMRMQVFDLNGKRTEIYIPPLNAKAPDDKVSHLICPMGFLDDEMLHRAYWIYGKTASSGTSGWNRAKRKDPSGKILVFNKDMVFGFGRLSDLLVTIPKEYSVFAALKKPPVVDNTFDNYIGPEKFRKGYMNQQGLKKFKREWEKKLPILVNSMVLTSDKLFVLGARDVVDELQAARRDAQYKDSLELQDQHLRGKHGSVLTIMDIKNGNTIKKLELTHYPVFDGMACAYGRIYISCNDNSIICLSGR